MKHFLISKKVWIASAFIAFFCLMAFDPIIAQVTVEPGTGVKGVIVELIGKFFLTTAAFAAANVAVSGFLLKFIPAEGVIKQVITLAIAVVLSLIGFLLKVGIFENLTIAAAIWTGVQAVGFGSNALFDLIRGLFFKKE